MLRLSQPRANFLEWQVVKKKDWLFLPIMCQFEPVLPQAAQHNMDDFNCTFLRDLP